MRVFPIAKVTLNAGDKVVIVKVPRDVADDPLVRGAVMHRAELELNCHRVVLLFDDTEEIFGNHQDKRSLSNFDLRFATWSVWNTAEFD